MKPVILFRAGLAEENELNIARKYFRVVDSRMEIGSDELVIARYSALPYYQELEKDIELAGAKLINSYKEHQFVAEMTNWYYPIAAFTPKTWFQPSDIPMDESGSFVLKGSTNSRKQLWKTHMFAPTRADVMSVYCRLLDDSLIQHQGIYVRQFANLKNFGNDTITGAPISKEFRCFFYKDKLLAKGFYWSQHYDELEIKPDPNEIPSDLINIIAQRVSHNINFWVADFAQKEDGEWIVIELNDAQMSGLSCVNADTLYGALSDCYN